MKLREFIERLSELDQSLDVYVYTECPYEDYRTMETPIFKGEEGDYDTATIEWIGENLYIGG